MRTAVLLGVLLLGCVSGFAEEAKKAEKPLTNKDVIALVEAKLSKDTIIVKVAQAAEQEFDLSTDGLVSLKKSGVPDEVISAMLKRQEPPRKVAAPSPAEESDAKPGRMARLKARAKSAVTRESDEPKAEGSDAASSAEAVTLYFTEPPAKKFKERGRVSAGKYNFAGIPRSREAVDAEMKKKAAALGADGVINITEDFAAVSGVAVEFVNE